MTHLLRSLIRETLLLEEVYGAQAVVYHGTKADPQELISALLNDEFVPGKGAGFMYGKGLYTVYDLKGTKTEMGGYGDHVIKLKVNLYGYIIFDPDVAQKVYKRTLTPAEQAAEVGYDDSVIAALKSVKPSQDGAFTSNLALSVHESLHNEVKGLVFTGANDGRVVVVYDPTTAVPMAWKKVAQNTKHVSEPWIPVDKAKLLAPLHRPDISAKEGRPVQQSALRRSATGDFEAGKWDASSSGLIKRLERMPETQRIVRGDLDLSNNTIITSLPAGLQIGGSLKLYNTHITSLPRGLQVGGTLSLFMSSVESLPVGLKVGGDLHCPNTSLTSLPADLQVGGDLFLSDAPIVSLSAGLKVGGSLSLIGTKITSIPADLQVGGGLNLWASLVTSLPEGLKVGGYLALWKTPIASLPRGLKVGGNLDIRDTPITSLPADLEVDGEIYGLNHKYWANVPEHLKGKLR